MVEFGEIRQRAAALTEKYRAVCVQLELEVTEAELLGPGQKLLHAWRRKWTTWMRPATCRCQPCMLSGALEFVPQWP